MSNITRKKIAILTLPLGHNYGGIMQNYALQKVLVDLNHEPLTIDRRPNPAHIPAFRKCKIFIKSLIGLDERGSTWKLRREKALINNKIFIKNHIRKSKPIFTTKELKYFALKNNFDAYIVGSDQVWRPKYAPDIYNFYLDFLPQGNTTKIAYGASFGTDEWEYTSEQTRRVAELIKSFKTVSVREQSTVNLTQKYLLVDQVNFVLDPTLLLSADDYIQTFQLKTKQKGLYSYMLDGGKEKQEIIDYCAEKLGLESYNSQPRKDIGSLNFKEDLADYYMPPVEQWIEGFKQAKFVLTDSFHGLVFAIIFNKPFIVLGNKKRGEARFRSLLEVLNLTDRLISSMDDLSEDLLQQKINYHEVNMKLTVLKHYSINMLKRSLC